MPGQPIKILHLIKSLGRGGAETLLVETAKIHARSHFELVVKTTVYYMKKGNVKQFMLPIIHIMTSISI